MSDNIEKCNFCDKAVNLEHELLWDLNSDGTWCGDCDGGLDHINHSVHIMEIIARRDQLMEQLPATRDSVNKLDTILTNRSYTSFRH